MYGYISDGTIILIVIAQGVIFGIMTSVIAASKGKSFNTWFLLGAIFSVFALVTIIGMTDEALLEAVKTQNRLLGEIQEEIRAGKLTQLPERPNAEEKAAVTPDNKEASAE